jgi:hypothetical protein
MQSSAELIKADSYLIPQLLRDMLRLFGTDSSVLASPSAVQSKSRDALLACAVSVVDHNGTVTENTQRTAQPCTVHCAWNAYNGEHSGIALIGPPGLHTSFPTSYM